MDFFETQERYRRREMRGWMTLLVRATVVGGCLWLGWLWGHAEQTSLQAEAELVIYENNVKISELSNENQALQRRLAALRAEKQLVLYLEIIVMICGSDCKTDRQWGEF